MQMPNERLNSTVCPNVGAWLVHQQRLGTGSKGSPPALGQVWGPLDGPAELLSARPLNAESELSHWLHSFHLKVSWQSLINNTVYK